jgi:tetratricopeptide (TPR) repeat protein
MPSIPTQARAAALAMLTLWTAPLLAGPAEPLDQAILDIQHRWAQVNYALPEKQRDDAFTALEERTAALAQQYPGRAEPLIWEGITLSTHAGARGGLGGLRLAKQARERLVQAEKIDPQALQGSIQTSLGTLYHKVPGWPLGFGDDDKAEAYLQEALDLNPHGIDPNYFYAGFLYDQHRYREAAAALHRALAAPPRPARPLADEGRHKEAQALLAKVREKLGGADALNAAR